DSQQRLLSVARHRSKVGSLFDTVSAWGSSKAFASSPDGISAPVYWDDRCANCGLREGIYRSLAAFLERQWWADAPVNDGLFVRGDAKRRNFNWFSLRGDKEAGVANATLASFWLLPPHWAPNKEL